MYNSNFCNFFCILYNINQNDNTINSQNTLKINAKKYSTYQIQTGINYIFSSEKVK